ncbi:MAG TPA: ABC transporter substrate-binding protein [Candidatus Methylomirabilis sp.]|nr:ABC transporter substrate-binding protein [Candidatus Methylomirabilis sp.]
MKRLRRFHALSWPVVVALTLAFAVALGVSPATAGQAGGKTLIMALDQSDMKTLDVSRQFEFAAAFICLNSYDSLLLPKSPQDLNTLVPVLATSWSVSKDGKEYTFKLRPNIKFASGNPFTAEDVRFTFTRLKNLKGNASWQMDPLKEVQVVDQYTVKTILNEPNGDWLAILSGQNGGIIDSKLAKEHGASDSPTADKDDKAEEWLNQNSAGSGPFILKGWIRNTGITLERNPNYWGTPVKVAKVDIRDVTSPATQKLQVENGDVDVAMNITPDLVATMRDNKNVKIITGQSLDNMYLGMTCDPQIHPELAKKEVRQAIRYAIDYDGIIALTNKQAVRGPAVFSIGVLGLTQADADRLNPKTDLKKAKDLLAKAGVPNGFKFPLRYGTGPSPVGITYDSIAQKIQADLKKVGIEVQLLPEEFGAMMTKYRAKGEAAVISYNTPDFLGPSDWVGQMVLHTWAPRLHYDSAKAKDMANKAAAETDPKKRIPMYQDLLKLLVDEGPYAMLVQGKTQVVTRPNISGYQYIPLGYAHLAPVGKD